MLFSLFLVFWCFLQHLHKWWNGWCYSRRRLMEEIFYSTITVTAWCVTDSAWHFCFHISHADDFGLRAGSAQKIWSCVISVCLLHTSFYDIINKSRPVELHMSPVLQDLHLKLDLAFYNRDGVRRELWHQGHSRFIFTASNVGSVCSYHAILAVFRPHPFTVKVFPKCTLDMNSQVGCDTFVVTRWCNWAMDGWMDGSIDIFSPSMCDVAEMYSLRLTRWLWNYPGCFGGVPTAL